MHHLWGMPYLTSDNDTYALPRMTHNFFFIRNPGSVRRAGFPSWSWAGWTHALLWAPAPGSTWRGDLQIAVELRSGSVVAWTEYSASHQFYTQNTDMLSQFIHINGYLISIRNVRRVSHEPYHSVLEFEHTDEIFLSCYAADRWLPLYELTKGQSPGQYALWRPSSLTPTTENGHSLSIPHLLLRNLGEHWECVANVSHGAGYKDRDGRTIEQGSWPGDLQVIRLG